MSQIESIKLPHYYDSILNRNKMISYLDDLPINEQVTTVINQLKRNPEEVPLNSILQEFHKQIEVLVPLYVKITQTD